jgi:hypothetical protein
LIISFSPPFQRGVSSATLWMTGWLISFLNTL